MKKILLLIPLLLVLLLLPSVFADFDVDYTAVTDTIFPDETARFDVTIFNFDEAKDSYVMQSVNPGWILKTTPAGITVEGESETSAVLEVRPRAGLAPGPYLIPIRLSSVNTNVIVERNIFVYLKTYTPIPGEYRPSVELIVSVPDSVDPRNKVPIEVFMRNRNPLIIDNLQITVNSQLFNKVYSTALNSYEEKTQELLFDIDPLVEPGVYPVTITLERLNRTEEPISQVTKNIIIIDYSELVEDSYVVPELFKSTEYVTVTNLGNKEKTGDVYKQRNWFQRIFTTTTPEATLTDVGGKKLYSWEVTLDPRQEYNIKIETNYRFLATIILIIILIIIGYYLFRSPIIALKKGRVFGSEEGSTLIKVKIFMKNRTKKPVYNISVVDKVPKLAKFVADDSVLGTLKPTKVIRHERAGTIVRWDLEKLDPFEERIITYKFRTHLKLVGSVKLASAKIRFDTGLGKERARYSNKVEIDSEAIRQRADVEKDVKRFRRKS